MSGHLHVLRETQCSIAKGLADLKLKVGSEKDDKITRMVWIRILFLYSKLNSKHVKHQ
jgi:hypothetical protein